jgi:ferredoxin
MTHAVTEKCIKCKYLECVEVCPVDCFYEGANMVVIHPDECIDCGACLPLCPSKAILAETHPQLAEWIPLNAKYAPLWPKTVKKRDPMPEADEWATVDGKLEHFDANPGTPAAIDI